MQRSRIQKKLERVLGVARLGARVRIGLIVGGLALSISGGLVFAAHTFHRITPTSPLPLSSLAAFALPDADKGERAGHSAPNAVPGTETSSAAQPLEAPPAAKPEPQGLPADKLRQLVRVWVYWDAVYPSAIKVRPGAVLLRLENRVGFDVSLVVNRLSGGTPGQVARLGVAGKTVRAVQTVELGAGQYVYYEESRPEIKGRLIVAPM